MLWPLVPPLTSCPAEDLPLASCPTEDLPLASCPTEDLPLVSCAAMKTCHWSLAPRMHAVEAVLKSLTFSEVNH